MNIRKVIRILFDIPSPLALIKALAVFSTIGVPFFGLAPVIWVIRGFITGLWWDGGTTTEFLLMVSGFFLLGCLGFYFLYDYTDVNRKPE